MKGTLITLSGAACWGLCGVVAKHLMNNGITALWLVDFRMLVAGLIMLSYAGLRNLKTSSSIFDIWRERKYIPRLLVTALFGFAVNQLAYFLSISYCNAGIATALEQSAPVIVLLFVIIKERRLPRLIELVVLALVVFGAFLLATGGDFGQLAIPARALFWGLIACVTCAMYTMLPGEMIVEYGNFETSGWCLLIGGLVMVPFSKLWIIPGDSSTWSVQTILGLVFVTLVGSVAAFGLYLYGTTLVGPERASVYGLFEAVVATFASLIFLGQSFALSDYIGIAAILVGILTLTLYSSHSADNSTVPETSSENAPERSE